MEYSCLVGFEPELSSHPPHLVNGSAVSAFIPFCGFEGQLGILEEEVSRMPNLNFPVCQSIVPTSLDGQLCYKLAMNKTSKGAENRNVFLLLNFLTSNFLT